MRAHLSTTMAMIGSKLAVMGVIFQGKSVFVLDIVEDDRDTSSRQIEYD